MSSSSPSVPLGPADRRSYDAGSKKHQRQRLKLMVNRSMVAELVEPADGRLTDVICGGIESTTATSITYCASSPYICESGGPKTYHGVPFSSVPGCPPSATRVQHVDATSFVQAPIPSRPDSAPVGDAAISPSIVDSGSTLSHRLTSSTEPNMYPRSAE